MLLKVQDSLSQAEVLELVFLCTDLLRKDLSTVTSATDLFSLLKKEDLLSSDDPSLLTELLRIIKRKKLIQELRLGAQLFNKRISPYRSVEVCCIFSSTSFFVLLFFIQQLPFTLCEQG